MLVLRHQLRRRPHVALGELVAAAEERGELLEDTLGPRHIGHVTLDDHLVPARTGADVEQRLEMLEVLVVAPEHRLDPIVGDRDFARGRGWRYGCNSLISLRLRYTRQDRS